MKRSEMIDIINGQLFGGSQNPSDIDECVALLNVIEKVGMRPPSVSEEDRQALIHVYIDPSFNRWDEDLEKDEQVMEAKRKRKEWKSKR